MASLLYATAPVNTDADYEPTDGTDYTPYDGPSEADSAERAEESDRLDRIADTLRQVDELHESGEWGRMMADLFAEREAEDAYHRGLIFA